MSEQTFSYNTSTGVVHKAGYIKILKIIIGDAFTNCNKKPMKFHCALVDTEEDRALGIIFPVDVYWPKWVIKKIEQYGCVVLSHKNNLMIGNSKGQTLRKDSTTRATPMQHCSITIRIIEEQDLA